ncbi:helix-turn-helix domain-containing protein [Streptomyces qinzhouensis]|uniref:Helix-turn-helix domain-containing protein n=1 Tax=Streptomyces qinzhouensis TaxID=2599401 RepID=A0A5B8J7B2_9ACTN|nr:helix-turn-helix transcriptional regulator [Streptomyces qinzhouensis]QDY77106.1 helix-turn-helix domain-containing protein [Streptomyces qinzhouensis]
MGRRNDNSGAAATSAALFGELLRHHRERANLSQEQLAAQIPCDRSLVTRVEAGTRVPQLPFVSRCDELLNADGMLVSLWSRVNWYPQVDHPDWFRRRAEMDALAEAVHVYQSQFMPGLLQSDDYAHALLSPTLGAKLAQDWTTARLSRQQRFFVPDGPLLFVVLDESALRNVVGSPSIMRDQCAFLLAAGKRPNIRIQVAPAESPLDLPAASFSMITLPEGERWIYSESLDRGHFSNDPAVHTRHARTYDVLRADALSALESAALITSFMEGYSGDGQRLHLGNLGQEQLQRPQRRRLRRGGPRIRGHHRRRRT